MVKKIISTEKSPAAIGPYNQGIVAGGVLYTCLLYTSDAADQTIEV
jgi:enamine deaminase RidA (YjgF/YER057c/UK114 family)